MARQINYEGKKAKIENSINKLNNELQKNEESIRALTEKKKEIKKKISDAEAELDAVKKEEIINMIAEKGLTTEELEKILQENTKGK